MGNMKSRIIACCVALLNLLYVPVMALAQDPVLA